MPLAPSGLYGYVSAGDSLVMQEQERWLSVEEIAAHLGVNRDTIYKWIERKQLPAHKLGKLWKFKVSEIDEWVRAGKAAEDLTDAESRENPKTD